LFVLSGMCVAHIGPIDLGVSDVCRTEAGNVPLVFARTPITWEQWVACWQSDQAGRGHPGLPAVSELVLPRTITVPPPQVPLHRRAASRGTTVAVSPAAEMPQTNPA
jgi:hypothetical protein